MTFDWTTWPFDPADVGHDNIDAAVSNLRDQATNGEHGIQRAVGALTTAISVMATRVSHYDRHQRHAENLGKIEHANREVYEHLLAAVDEIYAAATAVDGIE